MFKRGTPVMILAKDEFHGRVGIVRGTVVAREDGADVTMYDVFVGSEGNLPFKAEEIQAL